MPAAWPGGAVEHLELHRNGYCRLEKWRKLPLRLRRPYMRMTVHLRKTSRPKRKTGLAEGPAPPEGLRQKCLRYSAPSVSQTPGSPERVAEPPRKVKPQNASPHAKP